MKQFVRIDCVLNQHKYPKALKNKNRQKTKDGISFQTNFSVTVQTRKQNIESNTQCYSYIDSGRNQTGKQIKKDGHPAYGFRNLFGVFNKTDTSGISIL